MSGNTALFFECSSEMSFDVIHEIFIGMISTGYWIVMNKLNLLDNGVASALAQYVNEFLLKIN